MKNAKKSRKTLEWEKLIFSSRKLEIPREFYAMMGTIKDTNDMDPAGVDDIKKSWQEYTKNCTKKIFTTQITHDR